MPVLAINFDTSIDDDIRRNYNPAKLEEDSALPALPKILNEQSDDTEVPKTKAQPIHQTQTQQTHNTQYQRPLAPVQNINNKTSKDNYALLKAGTKIRTKSLVSISDRSKKGTKVSFVSKYPVSTTYFTVPTGTVFKGKITSVHKPQLTANGGLMVIKIDSMVIKGETYPIDAYISKAHYKKVFFNNIKGERKYYKSMIKSTKPGRHFYRKMTKVSESLMGEGSNAMLVPFSIAMGLIAVGGNVIAAPVLAIFYKGGSAYIPEGADFEIKLGQDAYIYN